MGIRWDDTLSGRLERIFDESQDLSQDVRHGAEIILTESDLRVPKESGRLAETGMVQEWRGGKSTAAITYGTPYARYIHEHLFFKHPHGGEAKFLEVALLWKGEEAINEAGEHFWRRIT